MGRGTAGGLCPCGEGSLRSSTRVHRALSERELDGFMCAIRKREARGEDVCAELTSWLVESWKAEMKRDTLRRERNPKKARGRSFSEQLKDAQTNVEYRGILKEFYNSYKAGDHMPYAAMRVMAFIRLDRLRTERLVAKIEKSDPAAARMVVSPSVVLAGYGCRRSRRREKARNQEAARMGV